MGYSVKKEDIERMIDEAPYQDAIFWEKEFVRSYKLKSGFTILGRAAVVDPSIYNQKLGEKYARENAIDQLWLLEGYRLQNDLHSQGIL